MLRIGMVDLDTSHPAAWIKVIRELNMDADVVAVYDSGTIYDKGYAKKFAAENKVEKACDSLEEMMDIVDVAFIQGCNWDTHVERARLFIEAGKGVLLDKPMVGNLKDLNTILEWHARGHKIIGGSSLRYGYEVKDFKKKLQKDEKILSVFASTSFDVFNYACHSVEMVGALLKKGARYVDYLGSNVTDIFRIVYDSGVQVILQEKCPTHHFFITVTTDKGIYPILVDAGNVYKALLEQAIPYFQGRENELPPFDELAESIKILLCCKKAMETGRRAFLEHLSESDEGFDGTLFAKEYKRKKFGG